MVSSTGVLCARHAFPVETPDAPYRPGTPRPLRPVTDRRLLDAEIDAYIRSFHRADDTMRSYWYAWRAFVRWTERRGLPSTLPLPLPVVLAYVATLVDPGLDPDSKRTTPHKATTVSAIINAIAARHVDTCVASPTDHPLFTTVAQGARRVLGALGPPAPGLPITTDQMRRIVVPPPPSPRTVWCLALLAVWAGTDLTVTEATEVGRPIIDPDGTIRVAHGGGEIVVRSPGDAGLDPARWLSRLDALAAPHCDQPFRARVDGIGELSPGASNNQARRLWDTCTRIVPGLTRSDLAEASILTRLSDELDRERLRWLRDRAFLLVGWHLGLRYSDWSRLRVGVDLRREARGWLVRIPHSKTDPHGNGAWLSLVPMVELCPVAALDEWVAAAHLADGDFAFVPLRGEERGTTCISYAGALDRVWWALERAGIDREGYATHALRYGFVVEALRLGHDPSLVADVTRHQSIDMVYRYARSERAHTAARARARLLFGAP